MSFDVEVFSFCRSMVYMRDKDNFTHLFLDIYVAATDKVKASTSFFP